MSGSFGVGALIGGRQSVDDETGTSVFSAGAALAVWLHFHLLELLGKTSLLNTQTRELEHEIVVFLAFAEFRGSCGR